MTKSRSIVRSTPIPASVSKPLVTPLFASVAYCSEDADQLDAQYDGDVFGYTYAREGHPNATVLATKLDAMEGATGSVITGSGMAALSAIYLGLLRAGDHVVAGNQLYGRNLRLLNDDLLRFGVSANLVDMTNAANVRAAMTSATKMIVIETLSNPTLRVADLSGIAAIAKESGALLVVDNTFTTPAVSTPLDHGADIVMHSVTKLLAGHSDVTLGYAASRNATLNQKMREATETWGLTPAPFDCWQAERGLHSFELRFSRAQENAQALADALAELDAVESVIYPGRPDHPDHNRVHAVMGDNPGNMLAFKIKDDRAAANAFVHAACNIPFAPTLGDVATTLSHPASSSHRGMTDAARRDQGITEGFFRVSVGIENPDLLVDEFTRAIKVVG